MASEGYDGWILIGPADDIDEEDLIRFDHDGKTFCVDLKTYPVKVKDGDVFIELG